MVDIDIAVNALHTLQQIVLTNFKLRFIQDSLLQTVEVEWTGKNISSGFKKILLGRLCIITVVVSQGIEVTLQCILYYVIDG